MKLRQAFTGLPALLAVASAQILKPLYASAQYSPSKAVPLDISQLLNNKGFGQFPGDGDFDGSHNSYPAQYHPGLNLSYAGFEYRFTDIEKFPFDNIIAQGQNISVPRGKYFSVQMLAAAETSSADGYVTARYSDDSATSRQILVPCWWLWAFPSGGDIVMPFYYTRETTDFNKSNIFQTITWLDSSKELSLLQMPESSPSNRLHIFAISLWPAPSARSIGPQLEVQFARSTNKWIEGTTDVQIFEVTVSNVGETGWILKDDAVEISIESEEVTTIKPGRINRLRPGDQVVVQVGVRNKNGVISGSTGTATAYLMSKSVSMRYNFEATFGLKPYEATYKSIYTHESPDWYNGAKFGIFIHWGLYSIPAWGNAGSNETYSEWYWWNLNSGPGTSDRTYEYHLSNYGPDVVYDDFTAEFSATAYSAKYWVDLFADAGATYFVQVAKHHDGYALYELPSNVSGRTSVALAPHRDLVKELFDAAKEHQPQLHRAAYYSLPEWFHPDYKPYGFGRWPGGNATNVFTNETLQYTGYVPVDDYLRDLVLPEMRTLASLGSEIMWCDIGGPNLTAEFAAQWYNEATIQGRQVVMNNRCGLPGDFDTPEYATLSATQQRKWESNAGMDPYSYGFNRATALDEYMNASKIVTTLIDIVSKNGNFLLDIGPMGNGSILDTETRHLREAGAWIKDHGEAIFNTTAWFITPQEGVDVRFTTTVDAFYVLVMNQVNSTLTFNSPLPLIEGDQVTVVGGSMSGQIVPSKIVQAGSNTMISFDISEDVKKADKWAWVFKVAYT